MDITDFYNDKKRLGYNPALSVSLKRNFPKSLISFDDRFVTVIKHLEKLIAEFSQTQKVKILDIGVGDAIYEKLLSTEIKQNADFYGIDVSKTQIQRSKEFLKDGKVLDLDHDLDLVFIRFSFNLDKILILIFIVF